MLKIRLQRVGRKHEPVFRLVLTDSKNSPKSGKFLEVLGSYDARRGEKAEFKNEKIVYWISKGAQVSGTVHNILVDRKVVGGKKINVLPKKKATAKAESEGTKAATAESRIEAAAVEEKAEAVSDEAVEAKTEEATPETEGTETEV